MIASADNLAAYCRELAHDRNLSAATVLRNLRAGHSSDDLDHGTAQLATRWGLTVRDVEQLAVDLDGAQSWANQAMGGGPR